MSVAERLEDKERREWSSERGSMIFTRLRDDVALVVLDGKLDDDAVPAWNEHLAWAVASPKVSLFLDAAAVTFPSTSFISAGTSAINKRRPRLDRFEVLVGGGLIEMIAKTANLSMGGFMQIGRDRAHFEAMLQAALK